MNKYKLILIILSLGLITACGRKLTSVSDYLNWYKEHTDLYSSQAQNSTYQFEAIYQPASYLAACRAKNDIESVLKSKEQYNGMYQFHLKISVKGQSVPPIRYNLSNDQMYYRRIEYFSFNMQDDIKMVAGKDTINCHLFHFEKDQNSIPYNSFVLGFDKSVIDNTGSDELKLIVSGGVFDNREIQMEFSKKNLVKTDSKLEELC